MAVTMKERLEIHKRIEDGNQRKLDEWKEEQKNEQYANKSAS